MTGNGGDSKGLKGCCQPHVDLGGGAPPVQGKRRTLPDQAKGTYSPGSFISVAPKCHGHGHNRDMWGVGRQVRQGLPSGIL